MTSKIESPPVKISHGPASIAGLVGIVAALVPLIIDALSDERLSESTRKWLLICGTALILGYMLLRGAQAVAAELTRR
jgi:hypothetical protein